MRVGAFIQKHMFWVSCVCLKLQYVRIHTLNKQGVLLLGIQSLHLQQLRLFNMFLSAPELMTEP